MSQEAPPVCLPAGISAISTIRSSSSSLSLMLTLGQDENAVGIYRQFSVSIDSAAVCSSCRYQRHIDYSFFIIHSDALRWRGCFQSVARLFISRCVAGRGCLPSPARALCTHSLSQGRGGVNGRIRKSPRRQTFVLFNAQRS